MASPARTTPSASSPTTFPCVDAVRGLAILGVVWIHVVARTPWQQWHVLGRFGAEFFVAIAACLMVYRSSPARPRPFGPFVANRFRRLVIPFIAWFAIHVALVPFAGWQIIDHLWFLPFLFVGLVCCWPLTRLNTTSRFHQVAVSFALVSLGFVVAVVEPHLPSWFGTTRLDLALLHAWGFVPGLFWGAAVGVLLRTLRWDAGTSRRLTWTGIVLLAGGLGLLLTRGPSMSPSLRNIAATGAVLVAIGLTPSRFALGVAVIGRPAFGVYLIHPALIVFGRFLITRDGQTLGFMQVVVLAALAVVVSLGATAVIRRSSLLSWMIPQGDAPVARNEQSVAPAVEAVAPGGAIA